MQLSQWASCALDRRGYTEQYRSDQRLLDLVGRYPREFETFVRHASLARADPTLRPAAYLYRAFQNHLGRASGGAGVPVVPGVCRAPEVVVIPAARQTGSPGPAGTDPEWGPPPAGESAAALPPGPVVQLQGPWPLVGEEMPGPGPREETGAAVVAKLGPRPGWEEDAGVAVAQEQGPVDPTPPASPEPQWPGPLAHPRAPPVHWSWLHAVDRRDLVAARPAAEVSLESHGALSWCQVWPSLCTKQSLESLECQPPSLEDELDQLLNLEAGKSYLQNAAWVGAFEAVAFRGYRRVGRGYQQLVEKLLQDKCRAMWKQNPWEELQLSRMTIERNSACRQWATLLSGADVPLPGQAQAAHDKLRMVFREEVLRRDAFWLSWLAAQRVGGPGVPGVPGLGAPGVAGAAEPWEPALDPYALAFELRTGIWLLDAAAWPEGLELGWDPSGLAGHRAWSPAGLGEPGAVPARGRAPDTGGSGSSTPYYRPALPWQ